MRSVNIVLIMLVAVASLFCGAAMPGSAEAETVDQLRQKAEQGDAAAQNELGFMYVNGQDVLQDYQEVQRALAAMQR